jgi:hypothetical protein
MRRGVTQRAQLGQTGLPDVTGGFLVLLVLGVFALAGTILCALGFFYRKPLYFIFGLVLASPLLVLVGYVLWQDMPRTHSWDFSAGRNISQLDIEPRRGNYYYTGNIRSTIRLPSNRHWSGRASSVVFFAKSGRLDEIYWSSRRLNTDRAYREAGRILGELGFKDHGLEAWYEKARGGEAGRFNIATSGDIEPGITVYMWRRAVEEEGEKSPWYLYVKVTWEK